MMHKGVVFVKFCQFCLLLLRCREPKEISTLDKCFWGYKMVQNGHVTKWSRDISRDLLTKYLYFIMLRTIS